MYLRTNLSYDILEFQQNKKLLELIFFQCNCSLLPELAKGLRKCVVLHEMMKQGSHHPYVACVF